MYICLSLIPWCLLLFFIHVVELSLNSMSVLCNVVVREYRSDSSVHGVKTRSILSSKESVFKVLYPFNNRLKTKGQNIEEKIEEIIEQIKVLHQEQRKKSFQIEAAEISEFSNVSKQYNEIQSCNSWKHSLHIVIRVNKLTDIFVVRFIIEASMSKAII